MMPGAGMEEAMATAQRKAAAAQRLIRNWKYEKEIGDGWIGQLVLTDEVPPIDQIDRVMLLIWYKDRSVLVRPADSDLLEIPTLTVDEAAADGAGRRTPAKALERWLKPISQGQWGIRIKDWYQHSRFEMQATPGNTDVEPGTQRFDLFLCATAGRLDDLPEGSGWARRTITTRDMLKLIRQRYTEFDVMLIAAHEDYLMRPGEGPGLTLERRNRDAR